MCITELWTETVNKLSDALFSVCSQNVLINQWMGSFQHLTLEALSNSIVFTEREVPGFAAVLSWFSALFGTSTSCFLTEFNLPCHQLATHFWRRTFCFLWHFKVDYFGYFFPDLYYRGYSEKYIYLLSAFCFLEFFSMFARWVSFRWLGKQHTYVSSNESF